MVNASSLLAVLATFTLASACKRTCESSSSSASSCSYTCWRACEDLPETNVRDNFLNAMLGNGHSCRAVGGNAITCTKDQRFGACNTHYWNCGEDC